MARINYPEDFLNQTVLFKTMKAKHDADGGGSPINAFLTQQGIDLVADDAATDSAIDTNKLFDATAKSAEDNTQDRNNLFDPVFDRLHDEVQFLKKFYAGNPAELGNWGVQIDENRVVYPPDFLNKVELFKTFKIKNDSFGPGASPLDPFLTQHNINLNDDLADTAAAEALHATMQQAKKDAEDLSEERDNFFDPVMANVRSIGQFLKGLYVDHPKHLGQWGYEVDDSPPRPLRKKRVIPVGGKKTVENVDTSEPLINTGITVLTVYAGSLPQGESIEVPVDGETPLTPEHEILTVVNNSETEQGEFSIVY